MGRPARLPGAAREALIRATNIANAMPQGPVYVNLDAEMQEAKLPEPLPPIDIARYRPRIAASRRSRDGAEKPRSGCARPSGRSFSPAARRAALRRWNARVALAEALNARVLTDLKIGASFPTDHPLHLGAPGMLLPDADGLAVLAEADVILSLDWVDLGGALKAAKADAFVISASLDHHLHNGWSMDHQALPPVDMLISADPDRRRGRAVARDRPAGKAGDLCPTHRARWRSPPATSSRSSIWPIAVRHAVGDRDVSLTHLPLSWNGAWWPFRHPLDFLGSDGGGGVGGGPGISVGAALALKGSGRLPVAICGDGDYLMGVTALWTAAHYRIPLLMVIANNRSFFNDELHQERVARMRNRPVENRWIGQRISDPDIDLAAMARAQGAEGFGPVQTDSELVAALRSAIAAVGRRRGRRGRCARRTGLCSVDDGDDDKKSRVRLATGELGKRCLLHRQMRSVPHPRHRARTASWSSRT